MPGRGVSYLLWPCPGDLSAIRERRGKDGMGVRLLEEGEPRAAAVLYGIAAVLAVLLALAPFSLRGSPQDIPPVKSAGASVSGAGTIPPGTRPRESQIAWTSQPFALYVDIYEATQSGGFVLPVSHIPAVPTVATVWVFRNGQHLVEGVAYDYTVIDDPARGAGCIKIKLNRMVTIGDRYVIRYFASNWRVE